ncbi:hypothetical protein GRF61_19685 [Azoarcus sp. TTM-91]|uniref:hypothetical protein n=1 Tax=Azoarcus sp. TTM-91 TaxID=2691581 RepID=UPI00145EE9F8|nr:hypothetical protein [Azoarcus sp. TTM-91]NMG36678.1 hypothetical protein [Azoarcus sp. TTM-91]
MNSKHLKAVLAGAATVFALSAVAAPAEDGAATTATSATQVKKHTKHSTAKKGTHKKTAAKKATAE